MRQSLVGAIPAAVIAVDAAGVVTAINPPAERLLGILAPEALGRPYTEALGPSLSDRLLQLYLRVARLGSPGEPQLVRATLPAGRTVYLQANVAPLRDAQGKPTGMLFIAGEATEGRLNPARAGRSPALSLTRREQQVAALIARGYSNRQVAEALVIADGTAANHVEHIREKLGFHSRAQIAVWAAEHGLSTAPQR